MTSKENESSKDRERRGDRVWRRFEIALSFLELKISKRFEHNFHERA